jgi:hypothetical protein
MISTCLARSIQYLYWVFLFILSPCKMDAKLVLYVGGFKGGRWKVIEVNKYWDKEGENEE